MAKRVFSLFGVVAVGHFALSIGLLAYLVDIGFMYGGQSPELGSPRFLYKALGAGTWLLLFPLGLFGNLPMLGLNSLLWGAGAAGIVRLWHAKTRTGAA